MSTKRKPAAERAPAHLEDALEPTELAPEEPADGPRCCPLLDQALSFTEAFEGQRPLPGLTTSHCFERVSGRYSGAQLTYHLPARGRGKARTASLILVCTHCPFCGAPQSRAVTAPGASEKGEGSRKRKPAPPVASGPLDLAEAGLEAVK